MTNKGSAERAQAAGAAPSNAIRHRGKAKKYHVREPAADMDDMDPHSPCPPAEAAAAEGLMGMASAVDAAPATIRRQAVPVKRRKPIEEMTERHLGESWGPPYRRLLRLQSGRGGMP